MQVSDVQAYIDLKTIGLQPGLQASSVWLKLAVAAGGAPEIRPNLSVIRTSVVQPLLDPGALRGIVVGTGYLIAGKGQCPGQLVEPALFCVDEGTDYDNLSIKKSTLGAIVSSRPE